MSTSANPSKGLFSGRLPFIQRAEALTRAAGRLSGRSHRQVMLPQLAEHVGARVCKSGLARQSSACILLPWLSTPALVPGRPPGSWIFSLGANATSGAER